MDRELAVAYAAQRRTSSEALTQAQQAWVRYRNAVCSLEQAAWGGINSISHARCTWWMLKERLAYMKNLKVIANNERYWPGESLHSGQAPSMSAECDGARPMPDACGLLPPLATLEQQLELVRREARATIDNQDAMDRTETTWRPYRDATCAIEVARYGKAHPSEPDLCQRRMTAERADFLKMAYTLCTTAQTTPTCFHKR